MDAGQLSARMSEPSSRHTRTIHTYPILNAETERALCLRWRDQHDISAAHQLAGSHIRLVVKLARGYRGYGLPLDDLIGEGHMGLMRAVCRFDPDRGARFATYAIWWIRAAIQEYVIRNCSVVKMGTTGAQKKLFFKLRSLRNRLQVPLHAPLTAEHVSQIVNILRVPEHEVIDMDQRLMGHDFSLNAPIGEDSQEEWQTWLEDHGDDPESALAKSEEAAQRKSRLKSALEALTGRERHIVIERHLRESSSTLHDLSRHYGLSKERVRQIERRALSKLRQSVQA